MNIDSVFQSVNDWIHKSMAWFSNSTSAMDLHTAVICAGVFVISALVVYLISVFGMRERTYEEAIEEQRRRNQEAIQQAKTDKTKKDKKFKKWGKKSKEKTDDEKNASCDAEKISEETDIKPEPDSNNSISNAGDLKGPTLKKKGRQRKSIMHEKGEEFSQPQSSSEETDEPASVCNSVSSNVQTNEEEKKSIQLEKSVRSKEEFKSQNSESSVDLPDEKVEDLDSAKAIKKSPMKKNKKTKVENSEQCQNSENADWNVSKLLNAIKLATLSEDEVQHLTDALNSKVKGNAVEKKKNEIAALKKLVQEKEDALRSEQKLCQAATEQINDLIQELNEKKAQATTTEKSLRDALNQEQQEIKALHGMMQRKREQYASELAAIQSKMQQMKNKMKEEHSLALQRLQEENNQLQSLNRIESEKQQRSTIEITRLQHEIEQLRTSCEKYEAHKAAMQQSHEDVLHQNQQLEKHIEQLVSSHQEEEYSYKQRINEMSNKIQQTENARSSLVQELQNAQSVCSSLEADNSSLRQRLEEAKHQLNSSEQDIMKLQSRLEEANHQQRDLANCLEKMRDEVMDLSNTKHEHLQIIQNLKQENESLASEISKNMERMSADGADQLQQNGETAEKSRVIDAEEHESIVQEKEAVAQRLLQELEQCKREIITISNDLDIQKQKNKELGDEKNRITEALSAAEKKMQDIIQTAERKVKEAQANADNCSNEMQNILNEQIKEVEQSLQENYSKELLTVKQEAESIKKEADERILKAETQANLRLEEFQESLYERLNQINFESEEKIKEVVQEKEIIKMELENFAFSVKEFLYRVFPNINVPQTFDNKLTLSEYEQEVKLHLEKLKKSARHDSKDLENMIKKLEENAAEKLNLEAQIKNYENVLAETENILKTLQNNIENEEKKWKKELESKDGYLKEVMDENEKLKSQNQTLQTNLEQLQGLREMEDKLIELRSRLELEESEKLALIQKFKEALYEIEELRLKLQKEELEKKLLQEKLGVLDSLTNSSNISVSDHPLTQIPEVNSNILPTKSEKRKKSRKRGASGKK